MKKYLYLLSAVLLTSASFALTSCSNDEKDESPTSPITIANYVSVDNATYVNEIMPQASGNIEGLTAISNDNALAGGANIVNVTSPIPLDKFYVGVEGVDGYYEITSDDQGSRAIGEYVYTLTLNYSVDLNTDLTIIISALADNGEVVNVLNSKITFVVSAKGDLTINLTFDQLKDVDLHLFMPDNTWIYYGNRGIYEEDSAMEDFEARVEALFEELAKKYGGNIYSDEFYAEYEQRYAELVAQYENNSLFSGLDHDSNAGCSIDALNNENIVIKSAHLIPGIYKVYVNMYSNCYPHENPTRWNCNVRFCGNPVTPIEGANPSFGEFSINEYSNDYDNVDRMQLAVKFELTADQIANLTKSTRTVSTRHIWAPLTESAVSKAYEGGHWYKPRYK